MAEIYIFKCIYICTAKTLFIYYCKDRNIICSGSRAILFCLQKDVVAPPVGYVPFSCFISLIFGMNFVISSLQTP